MPKSRKKKSAIPVLVPEKPTANLTSTMRAELYATPESFENVQGASNNIPPVRSFEQSGTATKTKISQHAIEEEKKEIGRSKVVITKINDMQLYDADVVRTYSLSSGTISYDSIKSMANESLEKIKINSKHVQNAEKKLHKVIVEQLLGDESIIAKMRLMSDSELNRRMTGRSHGDQKTVAPWGLWETILTKKCINEVVENFFASPRDDIELTMKLSRRNVYPRLHIELAPIYHELHIQAARLQQNAIIPFTIGSRHRRFDDLLRVYHFIINYRQ
uniref:Uncharacterized protein n=1 Tax=Elaeophora elaphi TaxID=1147741 RepID=A0A0R3RT54_9BILA